MLGFFWIYLAIGAVGAVSCTLLAIFAKPLNLGLANNIGVGLIVAPLTAYTYSFPYTFWGVLLAVIIVPIVVMTLIGVSLNRRAR